MATRVEIGWQSEKTLGECMSYMLDNEIATDVCFVVGPPDGATVNIRAHKLILIARSPIFEAMFSSGMTECRNGNDETIRIEDINADIFKSLLKYIYCDKVDISPKAALPLMYAANKYLLPKLSKECSNILQTSVKVENVCFLLDQSLLFSEENLRDDCLRLISRYSDEIFESKEFLNASCQALEVILKNDKMRSKESTIYKSCENWAKHQLSLHQSNENPSDEQIRESLGSLLYDIRFPTMDPEEFADLLGDRNILTAKEKSSVYFYYVKKGKPKTVLFDVNRRQVEEKCVDRTITVITGLWNSGPIRDSIAFTTDKEVKLSGLGLFTGHNGNSYDVDIDILDPEKSLFQKRFTIPFTGNATPFKIPFDLPITIRAVVTYTIVAFAQQLIGHHGQPCQVVCESHDTTFTFSNGNSASQTNVTLGQIPQLFFF